MVIHGAIVNLLQVRDTLERIVAHLMTSTQKKSMLQRYIFLQKNEIIEEVDKFFLEANWGPSVVNLFCLFGAIFSQNAELWGRCGAGRIGNLKLQIGNSLQRFCLQIVIGRSQVWIQ